MSRHRGSASPCGEARLAAARAWRATAVATLALLTLAPASARAVATGRAPAFAPKSDMQITGAASAGFGTGLSATYTLTLDNNGPQGAVGPITVTNTLPAGLTYTSVTGTGSWTCSTAGQVATCTWAGTYNKSVPTTITIGAFITSAVATSVTNIATVSYPGLDDSNLANNTASTTSAVTVRAVATTPDGATISQLPSNGTNYTQTFVVTNTGSISDSYTVVATVAPAGVVTIVSAAGVAGNTATTTPVAVLATRNVAVVYSVATGAATGAIATITLTATSIVTNSASNPGNLAVTVTRAGITMAKALYRDDRTTLVTGGVATGEYVQYRVAVTSTGGADATNVSVADNIPTQVSYVAATGDLAGWTFAPATPSPTLTATLTGALSSGSSRYFWIRVRVK